MSGGSVVKVASTMLQPRAASAGAARRFVTSTLTGWHHEAVADTAALLISELVTNAVLHAGTGVELRVLKTSAGIRCEVTDAGDGTPNARQATVDETGGRGLHLVEALSERWGVKPEPVGKAVWFELATG